MKKLLFSLALSVPLLSFSQLASSEEKYSHFPALVSTDVSVALCNIHSYNEKLTDILGKEALSTEDMVKVHEITYTLENAINYLKSSLEQTSVDLEKVHKASERLNATVIQDSGADYLKSTQLLGQAVQCK